MLRKRIAQDLLFYVFEDKKLVAAATGFTKGRSGVLSEAVRPILPEDFMDCDHGYSLDEAQGVLETYHLLCECSDLTLSTLLHQIEMAPRESVKSDITEKTPPKQDDLKIWTQRLLWSPEQAALVSVGLAPTERALEILGKMPAVTSSNSPLINEIRGRTEILDQATRAGHLSESGDPMEILDFLLRFEFEVPERLLQDVKHFHGRDYRSVGAKAAGPENGRTEISKSLTPRDVAGLQARGGDTSLAASNIDTEKTLCVKCNCELEPDTEDFTEIEALDKRAQNSILRIMIGLVLKTYELDPREDKSLIFKRIADDLSEQGVPIHERTVKKWIKRALPLVHEDRWKSFKNK